MEVIWRILSLSSPICHAGDEGNREVMLYSSFLYCQEREPYNDKDVGENSRKVHYRATYNQPMFYKA